ncbi:ISKra4 family transposase (plasmid) [Pseudarthrobacter sp. P1]|uniref:ISKra4 family transposase n=1 Tax=Pseudarthrobacter sp. P1 TaxID=3418418 RepID=UPI003CF17901
MVTIHPNDEHAAAVVRDVLTIERDHLSSDTFGLHLHEAKDLLRVVQETMATEQARAALAGAAVCASCGAAHRHKDTRPIVVRTPYGVLHLDSPRWWHCLCTPATAATFSPLAELLPERATPELMYLETKFAGLAPYGAGAKLLAEVLPLGRRLHATAVRLHAQAVAQRLEDELGAEQFSFIDTCQREREELPRPDLPILVGLDGGYVHSAAQRSRTDGWFEVIAGKIVPAEGKPTRFAYVQTYDSKPKRRLYQALRAQGMQDNQCVTFLTDGGEDIRDLPCYLNPQSEHLLDWFHITMRITVMANMAKSLQPPPPAGDTDSAGLPSAQVPRPDLAGQIAEDLQRLKWLLWHGNVFRALITITQITVGTEIARDGPEQARMAKAIGEFDSYIRANTDRIPNYGERRRAGEAISTAFTESTVNQVISKRMVKKQQMRWTPRGAHLLLQIRTRVLDGRLDADFHRWYPGFAHCPPPAEDLADAA